MKFYYLLIFSVLFMGGATHATTITNDSIKIQGKFLKGNQFFNGSLWQFGVKKTEIVKFEIKNGVFSFSLSPSIDPGVYRLQFDESNEKPYVDLIVDGIEKNIVFEIYLYNIEIFPVFQESIQNRRWYTYLKNTNNGVRRLGGLFNYLTDFHDTLIDRLVIKTYSLERDKYYVEFSKFIHDNKNSWCGLLVKNRPYYFSNLKKAPVPRDFIRKNFFWEDIDTNNPNLINSPLYVELINIYLDKFYINPVENYTDTLKEYNLKKGIDVLLEKFSKNTFTKKFITEYLQEYFDKSNKHEMAVYVNSKANALN